MRTTFSAKPWLVTIVTAMVMVVSSLSLTGCSKSESGGGTSASGGGLLSSELLQYVPANNVGFGVSSLTSSGYQKYKKSAWGSASIASKLTEQIQNSDDPGQAEMKRVLDLAQKLGILSSDPNAPDVISDAVVYAAPNQSLKKMEGSAFVKAAAGQDLTKQLAVIKEFAQQEGMKVSPETVASAQAFSMAEEGSTQSFVVAATADRLAISTNKDGAARLWGTGDASWVKTVTASPNFQRVTSSLPNQGEEFGFFYSDFGAVADAVTALGLPGSFKKEDVPVQAIAFRQAMADAPSTGIAVAMEPRDDMQKRIFAALSGSPKSSQFERFSNETVLFIGLDGKLLKTIKDEAIASGAPVPPEAAEQLNYLDTTESIGLGIRTARATSPFPEVVLAIQNSNAAKLASFARDTIEMFAGQGGPGMSLQQKKIADIDVSYMLTPLGVGVYLGSTGNSLYLASSEPGFEEMVQLGSGKGSSLASALPAQTKSILTSGTPLVATFIDYERGAELVKGLQGSLAMFTGGQALVEDSELESFRKLGKIGVTAEWKNNTAVIQFGFDAPGGK